MFRTIPNKTLLGDDVSVSAIRQHLNKLKKEVGGGGDGDGLATPMKAKATPIKTMPKKSNGVKTPTSEKRKARSMSDEDDSEDERAMTLGSVTPRAKFQRRSKTSKSYRDEPGDELDEAAVDEEMGSPVKQEAGCASVFDQGTAPERTAGDVDAGDLDAMSDFSSFEPGARDGGRVRPRLAEIRMEGFCAAEGCGPKRSKVTMIVCSMTPECRAGYRDSA